MLHYARAQSQKSALRSVLVWFVVLGAGRGWFVVSLRLSMVDLLCTWDLLSCPWPLLRCDMEFALFFVLAWFWLLAQAGVLLWLLERLQLLIQLAPTVSRLHSHRSSLSVTCCWAEAFWVGRRMAALTSSIVVGWDCSGTKQRSGRISSLPDYAEPEYARRGRKKILRRLQMAGPVTALERCQQAGCSPAICHWDKRLQLACMSLEAQRSTARIGRLCHEGRVAI